MRAPVDSSARTTRPFTFSREPGTLSAEQPDQLPQAIKDERYAHLMEHQRAISLAVQPLLAEALAVADTARASRLYRVSTSWLMLVTWNACMGNVPAGVTHEPRWDAFLDRLGLLDPAARAARIRQAIDYVSLVDRLVDAGLARLHLAGAVRAA